MIFIAEIGLNHQGSMEKAIRMIDESKRCHASIVKFQWYDPEAILGKQSQHLEEAKKAQFTYDQHKEIKEYCDSIGIEWACSIFHPEQVEKLEAINVNRYKIASRSIADYELLREIAKTKKPVIASTGWAFRSDIEKLCTIFKDNDLTLMYCVAEYPTPPGKINLKQMDWLRQFCKKVGFSSHCPHGYISIQAAMNGAVAIENHVVLDKTQVGCDVSSSLDFNEYKKLTDDYMDLLKYDPYCGNFA